MVSILFGLIVLSIVANTGKSIEDVVRVFNNTAIYISALNIFIAMPVWIVVLLFNKRRLETLAKRTTKSYWEMKYFETCFKKLF